MVKPSHSFFKRLAADIAGIILIILSVLTGWIPGPGGIPLLVAGLSLLAINHDWAKRWLKRAKSGGLNILDRIFIDHPLVKWGLDILGAALIGLSVFLLNNYTQSLYRSLAISAGFMGIGLFLGNRQRLQRFSHWFKSKAKR